MRIRVRPKARKDEILGTYGEALKVSVKDPPERGKANQAVCALLAKALGVPAARVTIATGRGSQEKTARVEGIGPEACRRRLEAVLR